MKDFLDNTGIRTSSFWQFSEDRIFTLPGLKNPLDELTILLTGSRSVGLHSETSDVDIEVLCPESLYETLHAEALSAGLIHSPSSFLCIVGDEAGKAHFGSHLANPHFSLRSIETAESHFKSFDDVWMWIWKHARVANDPNGRFEAIRSQFNGYPTDVRVKKIQYHWLAASYNAINLRPRPAENNEHLLTAMAGLTNSILDLLRVFFLVEDQPFPYAARLLGCAKRTALGRQFYPLLSKASEIIAGNTMRDTAPESRLQAAFELLYCAQPGNEADQLDEACQSAMIAADVPEQWVRADFENIGELWQGALGPSPF